MTFRRLVSMALALAIAVTLVPMVGGFARAEAAAAEKVGAVIADEDGFEAGTGQEDVVIMDDIPLDDGEIAPAEDAVADEAAVEAPAPVRANGTAPAGAGGVDLSALASAFAAHVHPNASIKNTVKITQKGSTVTIKGSVSKPYLLGGVILDDTWLSEDLFGTSVNYKINMNSGDFATGYHTAVVGIYSKNADGSLKVEGYVAGHYLSTNLVKDKPTYKGVFDVYNKYIIYYPYNMAMENTSGRLYMEYSSDGGKTWNHSGYMTSNWIKLFIEQNFEIDGLKPNTTYKTRIRYGEEATYSTSYEGDGKTYVFFGPALTTTTIKTGMAQAPKIKSIKAKATKVKFHKHRVKGHYEWSGTSLIWIGSWTEKYYTCKVKVTVKLKKKPGSKGLWIGFVDGSGTHEKWVKGNKKKYTATFTPYPNYFSKKPKGHYKYTITVRSGQSKSWGGYSPRISKKKKLK